MSIPDNLGRSEIEGIIQEWIIGRNAERDREIIRRRLFDGITYEQLAEEYFLSPRHTRKIVHDCEIKIFKHIPG